MTIVAVLNVHPSRARDLREPDQIQISPDLEQQQYLDCFGNICTRVSAPAGPVRFYNSTLIEDSGEVDPVGWDAPQLSVSDLPPETLQFLLASRYCEVDRMSDIAWNLFGETQPGWSRAQAILDWVHNHITFGYNYARPTKTALDAYN
jgi:transglutaminase-like putative cysteine protease